MTAPLERDLNVSQLVGRKTFDKFMAVCSKSVTFLREHNF